MDLLASLGLTDVPEQQTRLLLDAPAAVHLGYDACCACGVSLLPTPTTIVQCQQCRRVSYCSSACRERDSKPSDSDDQDGALGHSAVICSLLQLCRTDAAVETAAPDSSSLSTGSADAARSRVRSEYESYPATLANVLMEGPCYQRVIEAASSVVVIHVLGASDDAELSRGPTVQDNSPAKVMEEYAEALAELVEKHENVREIVLQFVGPECPSSDPWNQELALRSLDKRVGTLRISTHQGLYHEAQSELTNPQIVVWFHPGFTVPDYEWKESLQCIPHGTPFLLTSNTEMEAIADTQFLLEQDVIEELPAGLADVLEVVVASTDQTFFTVNPFSGLRVRQNESLANDVYVKNRWMLGGVIGPLIRPEPAEKSSAKRVRKQNAALI